MEANDKICRICLKESINMKALFTLKLTKDETLAVDFIRKITDLKVRIIFICYILPLIMVSV